VTDNQQTIKYPSSPDQLTEIDDDVERWLGEQNLPEDTLSDLTLVVTELVNNAIQHGNERNPEKEITVVLSSRLGEIEISVSDSGLGFDPNDLPNPLAEENHLKPSGRGLFVVKSLVDQIRFSFSPEGGTTVTVIKKI